MNITQQSWFAPTIAIMVLLPLSTLILTELISYLSRRSSPLVNPIRFLRNYLFPSVALYLLLTNIIQLNSSNRGVQVVASVAGLCVIMFILSSLKVLIFDEPANTETKLNSWRSRMPQIFIDVLRFTIIAVGLAFILQTVWGINIPGFFETLGVTAIVVGLALQSVFGGIVSGLLMQFERPFEVGDYIKVPTQNKPGLVTNISWRSTTVEVNGVSMIVPNDALAKMSIENLTKSGKAHVETLKANFSIDDAPSDVNDLLVDTAAKTNLVAPKQSVRSRYLGEGKYEVDVPLMSHRDAKALTAIFNDRLWYAAKRKEMTLDKGSNSFSYISVKDEVKKVSSTLHMDSNDVNVLSPRLTAEQFADGEVISEVGHYFDHLKLITAGQVRVEYINHLGDPYPVMILDVGDYIGQEMLSHQATPTRMIAVGTVTFISFSQEIMDDLLNRKRGLVQDIGKAAEDRGKALVKTVQEYGPKNKLISMETVLQM